MFYSFFQYYNTWKILYLFPPPPKIVFHHIVSTIFLQLPPNLFNIIFNIFTEFPGGTGKSRTSVGRAAGTGRSTETSHLGKDQGCGPDRKESDEYRPSQGAFINFFAIKVKYINFNYMIQTKQYGVLVDSLVRAASFFSQSLYEIDVE